MDVGVAVAVVGSTAGDGHCLAPRAIPIPTPTPTPTAPQLQVPAMGRGMVTGMGNGSGMEPSWLTWALLMVVVVVVVADPAKFGWLEIIIVCAVVLIRYLFIPFAWHYRFTWCFANEVTQIRITFVALC